MDGVNGGSLKRSDIVGEGQIIIHASMDSQSKKAITDFLGSLNQIVRGDKIGQYFDNLSNVTAKFAASLQRFKKDTGNFDFAKSLVNDFNALEGIAQADGKKIQDVLKGVAGGYDNVMQSVIRAREVAGSSSFDGITAKAVQDLNTSGRVLEQWGADVKRIIEGVTLNTTTEELQKRIRELNETLAVSNTEKDKATAAMERYKQAAEQAAEAERRQRELYNETFYGDEYQELSNKAEKYNEVVRRNVEEVKRFIEVSKLGTFDSWGDLERSVDNSGIITILTMVETDSMDATEAIVRLKEEYGSMIDLSNTRDIGEDKLTHLESAVQETVSIVRELKDTVGNAGFGSSDGQTVLDRALGSSEEIRGDTEALRAAQTVVVNFLNSLISNDSGITAEQTAISGLVAGLKELASVDVQGLTLTSDIMRRLPNMANVRVNTDQMDNLVRALKSLSQLSKDMDLTALTPLTNVNLSGFNGLSVSKASLSNLATYLPVITGSGVDIDKLRALSQISLANLNKENLSVSNASFEHLRELIQTIQGVPATPVSSPNLSGMDNAAQSVDQVIQKVAQEKDVFREADAELKQHVASVESATKAEAEKAKAADALTAAIASETEAIDKAAQAADRHKSALGKLEDSNSKEDTRMQRLAAAEAEYYAKQERMRAEAEAKKQKQIDDEVAKHNAALAKEEEAIEAATKREIEMWERAEEKKLASIEKTASAAVAAEQKAAEAAVKRTAYDDTKRAVNQYYGLLTSKDTNAAKREDVVMTDAGWASQSGRYAELAQQLNDATASFNMLTDAQNKNNLSGQQIAAINELIATRQKDYALAVENTAAKEAEHAQKSAELAQKKQQEAEAAMASKEAKRQEAEATKAQAQAEKDAARAAKEEKAEADKKTALLKKLNSLYTQCTDALRKYAAASKLSGNREAYDGINSTRDAVAGLIKELDVAKPDLEGIAKRVQEADGKFSTFSTTLKTNGGAMSNWLTTGMSQLKSRLSYTFGLAAMVYKAVGEIKKMVTTAVELDSAMNELQIVTRSSGEELAAYGTRVSAMAKETAQATKDLIDATTVYARLGYSMDDSAVLSKYTAMLQGVGDIEAGAAQDAMTAILKAFNVNIDEVESVMDKLVVVGNNFPISVSQLAEGMNNAGSMLAVAGNTFEESIALLTASNATVQNISKASTGLRTIAARIRKMDTEDGEIVEESKYNAMIDALTRHNVALVDANGEYRKTYDIIKDIAGVWGQMTSMQKSAVVEALAGTRQQNIFASLMTQFGDAEKAMKRMENATGELEESYDIYLNSIKAHTQQLKAAFDELSVKVVNSDFVKGVVDFVRKLVEGLSKLVDSVGTLGVALAAFGSLAIIKFIAGGGWVGFVLSLTKAVLAIVSVAPHLLAFAGLFASILLLVKAWRQAHPSMDTLVKEADTAQKKVDELNKTLESNKQRIEELNKLKTDGSITEAQEKELAILKQQTEELKAQLHVTKALADTAHANVISKVHGDVNAFFNAPTQGRYLGEGAGEGAIYEQADPAAEKLRRDLERYQELQKEIDHVNTKIGFANREYEDAVAFAEEMQAEVAQKNVDLSRTVFGNIDTENRLRLEWTKDTVKQYKDILQGYLRDGEDVEDWIGSYSTVLGQWDNFDVDGKSIPIAFSPILQTMNGPVLLDDNTVSDYINDVISEAERRGDTSAASLLKIDASGLFEHDGMMLWGLIADIGDEAERVADIMHYAGTDGALIDATQTEAQALQNINSILQQKKDLEAEIAQISGSTAEQEQQLLEWRKQLLNEDDSESIELLSQLEDALDDIQKVTKKDTYEVEKFKRNLDYLDKTVRNNLAKGIKNLSDNEMQKFDDWLKRCGYDIESFNKILAQMGKATEDVDLDSEGSGTVLEMHVSQWGTLTEEIQKATAAMEEYEDKMKGLKGGTLAERLQEGWADTMDEISQGRANSDAAWAFYELLFSDEQIDAAGRNVERLAQMVASYKAIFDDDNTENGFKDDDSPFGLGQRLIHFLEDNAASYQNIRFERDASGLTYVIADFKALADEMGWAEEAFTMLIQDAQAYSDTLIIDTTQYNKLVDGLNAFTEGIDPSNINEAKDALQKFMEVAIQEEDYVGDRDFLRMLDMLNGDGYIQLDPSYYREILEQAKKAVEEAKALAAEEAVSEESNPTINMDIDEEQILSDTETMLNNIQAYLDDNPRYITYIPNEYDYEIDDSGSGSGSESRGGTSVDKHSSAIGKQPGKNGGDTLVNELGPELISDNGRAFIANGGKPGFVHLSDDAIVFTAKETKDILKGKRNVNGKALVSGNVGRGSLIGRLMSGNIQARAYIRCPVCGTANPDYRASCYNCGASLHGGSAATVNNSRGTTGTANAGVNRSALGSPTAVTTGQNQGGNGYYYNPSTQTITYTTYTYDENSGLGIGVNNEYKFYESMYMQARRDQEKLEAELYKARQQASIAEHKNKLNETNRNTGSNKNKLSGSGGGNHVGGSDYGSQSDPQKVDWIAVRINRLQRTIADLEKVASSGFKKLDKRLSATKEQIKKTSEEISDMDRAYYRYMAEADSVGLSSDLVHKVREGTIDISEYDDETRKQIDEYTEWYEKALDAKSAIEELHQDIAQLYVDSFDAVQTDFENQLAQIEHSANMTSKHLEMAQTKGYLDSANFYEQLASDQEKTVTKLGAELDELNAKMQEAMKSGEIDEGSEAWYQMKASINEVEEALADANIQLVQYQRTIRQLDWTYFDYAQERMSQLNTETQFFVDLMAHHDLFSDNGQFNNLGEATAGLHAVNYDVYMEQAEAYAEQIQKIQKDLESDPYDTELIARREQLLDLQRQSISSAEGEKEALKSLVQEGISKELEALKDLIDTYKDSLDSAKDLYEYQKKVTEQTSDIASLQKQLAAYQGDTSEENRARVQKLQNDLRKAQTDLRETEWDQNISDQKKLLDDLYDEYEDLLNTRLDNIDLLMQEMIAGTNTNMDSIRNTLIEVGDEVGYSMTDQLTQALSNDLSYYDHVFEGINSVHLVLTNIYDMVSAMARASGAVKAYATGGLVDYTGLAAVHGTKARPELMLNANDTVNFLEAAKLMRDTFTGTKLSGLPGAGESGSGVGIGQLVVNIPIERVQDYNDFVRQLQNDPKFDRLISAMTLDRTLGKSAFGKNRIMF